MPMPLTREGKDVEWSPVRKASLASLEMLGGQNGLANKLRGSRNHTERVVAAEGRLK